MIETISLGHIDYLADHESLTCLNIESDCPPCTWSFICYFIANICFRASPVNPKAESFSCKPVLAFRPNDLQAFVTLEQVKVCSSPLEPWPNH